MVVDYASMDTIIAQELGKRSFRRIPIKEAVADLSPGYRRAWAPDLVSVSKEAWQTAVKLRQRTPYAAEPSASPKRLSTDATMCRPPRENSAWPVAKQMPIASR